MNKKLRNSISVKNAVFFKTMNSSFSDDSNSLQESHFKSSFKKLLKSVYKLVRTFLQPILIMLKNYLAKSIKVLFQPALVRLRNYLTKTIEHHLFAQSKQLARFQLDLENRLQVQENSILHKLNRIEEYSFAIEHHLFAQSKQLARFQSDLENRLQVQENSILHKLNRIEEYSFATARRVAVPCGPGEILIRSQMGFILCSTQDPALVACLLDTGDLEIGTRLLIQKFLNPGDTFVDIGANIGIHTLAAARAMQGQGKIIAIEPFENTAEMLKKSVWLNGFLDIVEIHQVAISTEVGTHTLYLGDISGHHSLFPLINVVSQTQSSVDVTLARLDDLLPHKQCIDLLKIDVEGAEVNVIESGTSLIEENPEIAIIVEFAPLHLKRSGKSLDEWMHTFTSLGLCYKVIDDYTGDLKEYTRDELMEAYSLNLFFAKPNSSAWGRISK